MKINNAIDITQWKKYINYNDYDKLVTFLTETYNGKKVNFAIMLYGPGSNGKTTFLKYVTDNYFTDGNLTASLDQLDWNKNNNDKNDNNNPENIKLLILNDSDEIKNEEYQKNIMNFLDNSKADKVSPIIKNANLIIESNDCNIPNNLTEKIQIIRFTHIF